MSVQGTTTIKSDVGTPVGGVVTFQGGTGATVTQSGRTFTVGAAPSIGGVVTGGTTGSVLFVGPGSTIAQDNANFFWDDTNNRLGIGTVAPAAHLEIMSTASGNIGLVIQGAASQSGDYFEILDSAGTIRTKINSTNTYVYTPSAATISLPQYYFDSTTAILTIDNVAGIPTYFAGRNVINYQVQPFFGVGPIFFAFQTSISATTNNMTMSQPYVFFSAASHTANAVVWTGADATASFFDAATYTTTGGGSFVTMFHTSFRSAFAVSAGTIDTRRGYYLTDATGAGTLTNQYGMVIANLTKGATLNIPLYIQGTGSSGNRIIPKTKFGADSSPTAQVEIQTASSTTIGLVVQGSASQSANLEEWQDSSANILSKVKSTGDLSLLASSRSIAINTNFIDCNIGNVLTLSATNKIVIGHQYGGTVLFTASQAAGLQYHSHHNVLYKNDASLTGVLNFLHIGFYQNSTFQADTNATTAGAVYGFYDGPTFSRVNAGTLVVASAISFESTPANGAGVTVTSRTGLHIGNMLNGTITNHYGIVIDDLANAGATTTQSLRILGTTSHNRIVPKTRFGSDAAPSVDVHINGAVAYAKATVSLTADNQAVVTANISYISISSDNATAANRDFVLNQSTVAGQELILEWTGTNAGQMIDDVAQGGGGNTRLSANWVPTQYDILKLISNGTDWIEMCRSTN